MKAWVRRAASTRDRKGVPNRGVVICRFCGAAGLNWLDVAGKWRLMLLGEEHICPSQAPVVHDEVLDGR